MATVGGRGGARSSSTASGARASSTDLVAYALTADVEPLLDRYLKLTGAVLRNT